MAGSGHYVGQRLSLKGQTCTLRYVGSVNGKQGIWLGVEWDDSTRGKHDGTHEGRQYFTCRSRSPTAASFIRPPQTFDHPKSFLEALKEKYISPNLDLTLQKQDRIYFSSKQAEEVGFDKFAARQAQLHGIRTLVLDRMCVRHTVGDHDDELEIKVLCAEITELDLGGNVFESYGEISHLCRCFPKLRTLNLSGNRFDYVVAEGSPDRPFTTVETLNVSNTLFNWDIDLVVLLQRQFPKLRTLTATRNEWINLRTSLRLPNLTFIDLSNNDFESLTDLSSLATGKIETVLLRNCQITSVVGKQQRHIDFGTWISVKELDIRDNAFTEWFFLDELSQLIPDLRHLRSAGNPVYHTAFMPSGQLPTADEAYMLIVARLPRLETLNYSKITDRDRMNAEIYYLNLVAAELSALSTSAKQAEARSRHPRFSALCAEYGEPDILRSGGAGAKEASREAANTLSSRLIRIHFTYANKTWTQDIPRSASVYEVLGLVGRRLQVKPLRVRLTFESHQGDHLAPAGNLEGPEWWNSDDEEDQQRPIQVDQPTLVELTPGTRPLATYLDSQEARIAVAVKDS